MMIARRSSAGVDLRPANSDHNNGAAEPLDPRAVGFACVDLKSLLFISRTHGETSTLLGALRSGRLFFCSPCTHTSNPVHPLFRTAESPRHATPELATDLRAASSIVFPHI